MKNGGRRPGAGRPKGTGKYGVSTRPVRIPEEIVPLVDDIARQGGVGVPLYSSRVSAGHPELADETIESRINLLTHLVKSPSATFCVKVQGESMINAGIKPEDILVVERMNKAEYGDIVIVSLDGEVTVKRLGEIDGEPALIPENDRYKPVPIYEGANIEIMGVVKNVIHGV